MINIIAATSDIYNELSKKLYPKELGIKTLMESFSARSIFV